jgi:hypothetical protein
MAGKNPFKIIEEENISKYQDVGPTRPSFLDNTGSFSTQSDKPLSGSPDFPSFS